MRKVFFIVVFIVFAANVFEGYALEKSLQGLKSVKIVCDMNVGEPKLLLTRMELLDTTYKQLAAAGMKPVVVVAFRGKASLFVTKGEGYVPDAQKAAKSEVKSWIERFKKNGFTIEQCAIAAEMLDIDLKDFLPEMQLVENGYVSLIGYQQQGYAFLPMD
jgi:intracellular sulfur oxidation DsrE/DsrF family protein